VNEVVNIYPREQISPLGVEFLLRSEVHPWGPEVKLRMALRSTQLGAIYVHETSKIGWTTKKPVSVSSPFPSVENKRQKLKAKCSIPCT
jgi:hypothetical protein